MPDSLASLSCAVWCYMPCKSYHDTPLCVIWANPGIGHSRKLKIKDFFKIMMITIAYLVSN